MIINRGVNKTGMGSKDLEFFIQNNQSTTSSARLGHHSMVQAKRDSLFTKTVYGPSNNKVAKQQLHISTPPINNVGDFLGTTKCYYPACAIIPDHNGLQ